MSTDAEKLAAISDLCDEAREDRWSMIGLYSGIKALLAKPGPAVEGVTLTPEEARDAAEALNIAQDCKEHGV